MRNITTSLKKGEHLIGGFLLIVLLIDKLCSVLLRGSYFGFFYFFYLYLTKSEIRLKATGLGLDSITKHAFILWQGTPKLPERSSTSMDHIAVFSSTPVYYKNLFNVS